MGFYFAYKPYVPVAKRREQAARKLATMQKKGGKVSPVVLEGRTIASSFWGKSWCSNLERYSDYASRLPRGRSYVRNGSVLDLQIAKGEITAKVSGSDLYTIHITIAQVPADRWTSLAKDCVGTIDSVVELLQGRIDKGVMDRVSRQGDGLFPSPNEIKLSCSCPDWADMCKHVAAALYGVGARLDRQPDLLFALRGVDAQDLIAKAGANLAAPAPGTASDKVLVGNDIAALFDLDMADEGMPPPPPQAPTPAAPAALPKRGQSQQATKRMLAKAVASKQEKGARAPATLAAKGAPGKGKSTAGAIAEKIRATGNTTPAKAKPGRAPLRGVITTTSSQPRVKAKPSTGTATAKAHARFEALVEEATVDAYTEAEQAVRLYTKICEHLALPFKSKVLGRAADVVEIEMGDDDRLRAVCKVGRKRLLISLADLLLPTKRPAGAEWIVAYRLWCSRNRSR